MRAAILLALALGLWFVTRPRTPVYIGTPGSEVIVFETDRDPFVQLYVMSLDGAQVNRLTYNVPRSSAWWWIGPLPFVGEASLNVELQPAPENEGIVFCPILRRLRFISTNYA